VVHLHSIGVAFALLLHSIGWDLHSGCTPIGGICTRQNGYSEFCFRLSDGKPVTTRKPDEQYSTVQCTLAQSAGQKAGVYGSLLVG